jgi:hypothetical protein
LAAQTSHGRDSKAPLEIEALDGKEVDGMSPVGETEGVRGLRG